MAFLIFLVGAALVGPGLMDWNQHKGEFTQQAKELTGLDLYIDGDVEVALLPTPALVVNDVRLANVAGSSSEDMISLSSLEVRIALGPLLGGQLQVQTIRLVDPIIEIERMADGQFNILKVIPEEEELESAQETEATQPENLSASDEESTGFDIRLENFTIENGALIYRDANSGTFETVESINASIAAASLIGPFESNGSLTIRNFPLTYDLSVGQVIGGRTLPVGLTLGVAPGKTQTTVTGAIVDLEKSPVFKGKVIGESEKLSSLLQGLVNAGDLPGMLGQTLAFEGELQASQTGTSITDLVVSLGDVVTKGAIETGFGETFNVQVDLEASSINMDKWLAMPMAKVSDIVEDESVAEPKEEENGAITLSLPGKKNEEPKAEKTGNFTFPQDINAAVSFVAQSMTLKGELIHQARLSAELMNGEMTISQLSAQLPGGSDVAVFGFVTPEGGVPQFEGEVEAQVSDLRRVFSWLGVSPPPVPSDRLRKINFKGELTANSERIRFRNIDFQFDSSNVKGAATVELRQRPSFGVDLTLDKINLDAYMPISKTDQGSSSDSSAATEVKSEASANNDNPVADAVSTLGFLNSFDANLRANVKSLVYGGTTIKDIVFDGMVYDQSLTVRKLAVDKMAGASLNVSGAIKGFLGIPDLKDVRIETKISDLGKIYRLAGVKPPANTKMMGAISLKAWLDGSTLKPSINLDANGVGASINTSGTLSLLPVSSGYTGNVSVQHGDLVNMLRSLGIVYKPAGKLGGLDLKSQVKADAGGVTLTGLKGKAGPVSLSGDASVGLDGPRPKITADLITSDIVADVFIPVSQEARMDGLLNPIPAAFKVPRNKHQKRGFPLFRKISTGRWPTDPIDLSALRDIDADVKLKSDSVSYGNYRLDNADILANLDTGVLKVDRLKGDVFGGKLDALATLNAAASPTIETTVSIDNLDIARSLAAVTGESLAKGLARMKLNLASGGRSVADLVAALSGSGSLALNKIDVKSGGKGTALSAALGLVSGLQALGGYDNKKQTPGLADISGTFNVDKGVAVSNDLKLTSTMGNGQAKGSVDLAQWLIDVGGSIEMSQNFIGMVLKGGNTDKSALPFTIKGRLDQPNVKLDTAGLIGKGLVVPGIDKVLKKGVGGLLQKIIPGTGSKSQQQQPDSQVPASTFPTEPPPPPSSEPSAPAKIKPKDLLKGLLKGLGG